jgi:hypothetical protein
MLYQNCLKTLRNARHLWTKNPIQIRGTCQKQSTAEYVRKQQYPCLPKETVYSFIYRCNFSSLKVMHQVFFTDVAIRFHTNSESKLSWTYRQKDGLTDTCTAVIQQNFSHAMARTFCHSINSPAVQIRNESENETSVKYITRGATRKYHTHTRTYTNSSILP